MVVELAAVLAASRSVITVYFLARGDDLAGGNRRERQEKKGREDYSEVMQLSLDFDKHRDAYLAAARDVVGVKLDGQETADEHIEKLHKQYEAATERQHDAERDLYGEYNGEAADQAEKERQRGRELRAYSCSRLEAQAQSDNTPTWITAEIALEESDCG